jgi:hypothetical protein
MKQFTRCPLGIKLLTPIFLGLLAWAEPASSQNVTWQALPFPDNANWPGSTGQPATITPNQVVLQGHPVRSLETYSGPITLNCNVTLSNDGAGEGSLQLNFIPLGQATNLGLTSGILFVLGYGDSYGDQLQLWSYPSSELWSNSFTFAAGANYQLSMSVAANGALSLSVNGQSYPLPNSATLPFSQFQLQMEGWQPANTWTVDNFAVVPEPTTAMLVGVSLAGLATTLRRRK